MRYLLASPSQSVPLHPNPGLQVHLALGNQEDALMLYTSALDMLRRLHGDCDVQDVGVALCNLATVVRRRRLHKDGVRSSMLCVHPASARGGCVRESGRAQGTHQVLAPM
jgi:hypothetical protein